MSFKIPSIFFSAAFGANVCYDKVGCFTDDPPFSVPGYRPRRLPSSPASVITHFQLTNKSVKNQDVQWDNPTRRTNFKGGTKVVVMAHGWIDGQDETHFLSEARDTFRAKTDYNYIAVDWSKGSKIADYFQAAANTQAVGRAIGYMFNELKKSGFKSNQFECFGHSLGSHVCSYAAKFTKSEFGFTIARVCGMDAAGPIFEKTTKDVRIDKSDATFVDLIHCNGGNEDSGFLGINAAVGHADFFPNGGHHQPKCGNNNFICSHNMCPYIVIDSVNQGSRGGCDFTKCSSEKDWNNGRCNNCSNGCNKMGYYATKPRSSEMYYGSTAKNAPYC